jgi:signal transduction histidine kinase
LLAAVVTDKSHTDEQTSEELLLETQIRAHRLADRLTLLVEELQRLGLRSEVDLLDQSLEPERELLAMAHEGSLLFNLGVAILDKDGRALWAQPHAFISSQSEFGAKPWFLEMRDRRATHVFPPNNGEPTLYIVSPIVRGDKFTGALVGGIDLTRERSMASPKESFVRTYLATRRGSVVFPHDPTGYTRSADWFSIFQSHLDQASTVEALFDGAPSVVATAPVPVGDLFLLNVATVGDLFQESDRRMWTRLLFGIFLALAPMLALVVVLRRSLAQFRRAETEAVREEHLRTIGEAANTIAHEVRNSLNGIGMGIDLMMDKERRPSERVVSELRAEIERLSSFTYQLMLFAKNPEPKRNVVNLTELVPKWISLTRDLATEHGVTIELRSDDGPLSVRGDATLLQIVVSNLLGNALDAIAGVNPPKIVVTLGRADGLASLRVEDNGAGVPESLRDRLFQPFVSGKPSGVGMGLSVSRKIANAHGGDLVYEPTQSGANFVLTLPLEGTA